MTRPRVTVVGSANVDLVVRVPRHPAPGETVLGSAYQRHPGGKGANQAVAAARLGAEVRFVGRVGDDEFGARLRAALEADGIDTSALRQDPAPTGVAFIQVDEQGENAIVVAPGANHALTPADVDPASIEGADVVLLQLEIPLATVVEAARVARAAGAQVVLNAAPIAALPGAVWDFVDVLLVNESEAAGLLAWSVDNAIVDVLPEPALGAQCPQGYVEVACVGFKLLCQFWQGGFAFLQQVIQHAFFIQHKGSRRYGNAIEMAEDIGAIGAFFSFG
ncbi:MAG: ribokinase [Trueperaceae bacterium]